MPAVTLPMGQAIAADNTITRAGVNLELLGRDFAEGPPLGLAYAYEQATTYSVTASASTVEMGETVEVTVAASDVFTDTSRSGAGPAPGFAR